MTFLTAKLEQGLHSGQLITGEGLRSSSRDHAHTHNAARIASDDADQQRELEWDTAPLGEVLWGVYGPDSFPSVFACKILDHPGQGRVLWGFSIYRRSPGFRTLGVSSLWAEQHGLHLFSTQAAAFSFIAGLFAKAVQP